MWPWNVYFADSVLMHHDWLIDSTSVVFHLQVLCLNNFKATLDFTNPGYARNGVHINPLYEVVIYRQPDDSVSRAFALQTKMPRVWVPDWLHAFLRRVTIMTIFANLHYSIQSSRSWSPCFSHDPWQRDIVSVLWAHVPSQACQSRCEHYVPTPQQLQKFT